MSHISTCPECAKPVTVPDGLAESAAVRCPVCDAEYPAGVVTEPTADIDGTDDDGDPPPELIPIVPSSESEPESADQETGTPVKCPCCNAQFGLAEVIVVATGEKLGSEAAAVIGSDGSVAPSGEKPGGWPGFGPSAENHEPYKIAIDTGVEDQPAASGGFDFKDNEADRRDAMLASAMTAAADRRRRDGGKHPLRLMVEIILGGVAGLAITYYGLNFFGGPRFNYLNVYLPGVAHTVEQRPAWWPSILEQSDSEETETDPTVVPNETQAEPSDPDEDGFGTGLPPVEAEPEEPPMEDPTPPKESSEKPADKPEAEPLPPPVGPANPPGFTSDELGQVLRNTHIAFTTNGLTEETYLLLSELAHTFTFVELTGGGPKLRNRLEAVDILLHRLGGDELNLVKIGAMAAKLARAEERTDNGILLAGTLEATLELGQVHGARVQLSGTDSILVVAGKRPMPAKAGDRVLVLGSIVDKPAENMVGVETSMGQVIWSRMTVNLDK